MSRYQTEKRYIVGIDVGSTTVKVVACLEGGDDLLFRLYARHESCQADTVLSALQKLESQLNIQIENTRVFITGSGGSAIAGLLGAKFVQEVTAVSLAVERFFPDVQSVVELGGQDSKIIVFQETNRRGHKKKIASMNDKCAGGTGAVIEKVAAKLNLSAEELLQQGYDGIAIHPVAGKCGVFAETDIIGLQKQGVSPRELMASLFDAVVIQNLTVLTRGHTLKPRVLLLGGPHVFLPGMRQAWRHHLAKLWQQQEVSLPEQASIESLVSVPSDGEFFGAIGAIEYGRTEDVGTGRYLGSAQLTNHVQSSRNSQRAGGARGLCKSKAELQEFLQRYSVPSSPRPSLSGAELSVFLGLDGGSTSTKAVLLTPDGTLLESAYQLSQADPITDAVGVLRELRGRFAARQTRLNILGAAVTGYSKDLLKRVFATDVALVETVAHAQSALQLQHDVDAIIDVGGQDIKIIVLQDGAVKDFRLNTQCSAGNGYFLQSAAALLGIPIENFAQEAFRAEQMPIFSYGCAVFLQSDIVNFQRQGWRPEEIIAGLAAVLPKNVFLYVAGVSNVARIGRRFLLQGGTQRNLAVVKAEIDFLHSHFFAEGTPEVRVHPNCGEAGAIGAALQAIHQYDPSRPSTFIGLDQLDNLHYNTTHDESTRCAFCTNHCSRTFIDIVSSVTDTFVGAPAQRIIIANCERGEAIDAAAAREVNTSLATIRKSAPCVPSLASREVWNVSQQPVIASTRHHMSWARRDLSSQNGSLRIGIPKVLNLYSYAPLFTAYLTSLGISADHITFSDTTTLAQFKNAVGFAAVDPCFPSKVCIAHVLNLLDKSRTRHKLDYVFFPMIDAVTTPLRDCVGCSACPAGAATPEAVKAAFSLNRDWFSEAGVRYLNPFLDLSNRSLFSLQLFECWRDILGISWKENARAIDVAFRSLDEFEGRMRSLSLEVLNDLERESRVGLVLLGRPYHHDPGVNQGILEAFQDLGYPVLSQSYLPLDSDLLDRLFGVEVGKGIIKSPLDISDVWKNSTSANTNYKIWAAKFAARHPNLIPVELSNFKCGHDAFVSGVIEQIVESSGKPYFCFRDLDENKPSASLRIRIETMHYFLKQYTRHPGQEFVQTQVAPISSAHGSENPSLWRGLTVNEQFVQPRNV
ncbi:MAG TPA: BadF/BadG/BcrA/BcrD ATPase family protein [Candidatus Saccharimonadales bacterium]|nr:BadF/BadG/BcrA/BcrD ATPase family protein [Candidatus Saccharimonadales bacterium]